MHPRSFAVETVTTHNAIPPEQTPPCDSPCHRCQNLPFLFRKLVTHSSSISSCKQGTFHCSLNQLGCLTIQVDWNHPNLLCTTLKRQLARAACHHRQ